MPTTDRARLLALARRRGMITAGAAARAGIHSQHLTRLVAEGALERVARGHYRLAGRPSPNITASWWRPGPRPTA